MLSLECGAVEAIRKDIHLNVLGINHFTWVDQASYEMTNLMPIFEAFAKKYAETGYALDESDTDKANPFRNLNKVAFDLYLRYHAIPAAGDRHIAEFMPPWYLKSPETAEQFGFALTKVAYRKQERKALIAKTEAVLSGRESFEITPSGEEGTAQIKALVGLSELISNVNLPNRGQVAGLPLGAIVETNALFAKDAARPLFAGSLPPVVNNIVSRHVANQTMIIEAGIRKDTELAFCAFMNDNLMTLTPWDAEKLFYEMLENTKTYLHGWKW